MIWALALAVLLQDPEAVALDKAAVEEIARHQGSIVDVDPNTAMGRFLRTFALTQKPQVEITAEMVERARAIQSYFAQPRYFAGKQILVVDDATKWITHRARITEVLPNDAYKVEVVEVLEWNSNMSPKKTRTVERVISHEEVARLNDPTRLAAGQSYFGIRHEPVEDPLLREAIEKANRIVDEKMPDFRKPPAEIAKQQRTLFLELMKVAKMMDHSLSVSPGDARYKQQMDAVRSDPFYGSRGSWAGAYIKGEYGVCTDQASVATQIVNSVARRAGIDLQLVSGVTLDANAGHGFTVANFRGDAARRLSDPSWENNKTWWKYSPPERYSGNLLLELEQAMGAAGFSRNRRITNPDAAEQIRTPAPSQWKGAQDRVASRVKAEAASTGTFVAAWLLKEAMNGRISVGELARPGFWGDLAVFTVAARVTESLPLRGIARHALPLAAGMAAVQLLHGQASWQDVAIDTASFLAAGAAVSLIADGLIYPALFAAGPPGWIAAGVYTVAKMAVTLYAGEKLGHWLRGLFVRDGRVERADAEREGVSQKLERVGE
jgi:hypothetical protein